MVSRVRVSVLVRKGWWSRECVFVCSRGRAGGLASTCPCARAVRPQSTRKRTRETTSPSSRAHKHVLARPPVLEHTNIMCWDGVTSVYECCSLPDVHSRELRRSFAHCTTLLQDIINSLRPYSIELKQHT